MRLGGALWVRKAICIMVKLKPGRVGGAWVLSVTVAHRRPHGLAHGAGGLPGGRQGVGDECEPESNPLPRAQACGLLAFGWETHSPLFSCCTFGPGSMQSHQV